MKTGLLVHESTMNQIDSYLKKKNPGGLILGGEEHLGKSLLAEEIAKILLCTGSHGDSPCGTCESCKKTLQAHSDFRMIRPDGDSIKIDQIREVIDFTKFNCVTSTRKVIVIDNADSLSEDAQDTLLKLLEDGNDDTIVILVTSKKLLPTIHSRCSEIHVLPLELKCGPSPKDKTINLLADGRPGMVELLKKSDDFIQTMTEYIKVLSGIKQKREIMEALGAVKEKDKNYLYDKYSYDEINVFFQFQELLFEAILVSRIGIEESTLPLHGLMDFDNMRELYSESKLLELLHATAANMKLFKEHNYNKNDFFNYLQEVVS